MNRCEFEGRLSGVAVARELPSGDVILSFRLVVPRAEGGRVDTIDCAVLSPRLRRTLARMEAGTKVAVEGELQRRFWRAASGVNSRYEVVVVALRRLR